MIWSGGRPERVGQCVAVQTGEIHERAIEGVAPGPGGARLLTTFEFLEHAGRAPQGSGGALAGAARAERGPHLLGLPLVAFGGQFSGLEFR